MQWLERISPSLYWYTWILYIDRMLQTKYTTNCYSFPEILSNGRERMKTDCIEKSKTIDGEIYSFILAIHNQK